MEPLQHDDPSSIGPYQLVARLGAGGMGRVYLARSAGGRTVAVKVVRAELAGDPDFRARFRREVSAAQSVDGAYTAPVVDADRDSDSPWLATAYVLGPSLTDAVAQYGPLPEHGVRALGAVLAEALGAIHRAGLIHRDLKPSNVLLAADGPRVIDFGIARALDGGNLTSTGVIVGSPGFMSPEQASGRPVGPSGDVFSLGSVLAFAATGQGPFGQDSAASMLYRVVHDAPDLTGLPGGLLEVIGACLAKEPEDRPSPEQIIRMLAPDGTEALLQGGWLPVPVASGIARHAAQVMEMETPAPRRPVAQPDPRTATVVGADSGAGAAGSSGTVLLGQGATSGAVPAGASAASPSRRRLLFGALGVVGVAAVGGGAAMALSGSRKPSPTPAPHPSTTASPSPFPTRAAGLPPQPLWTFSGSSLQNAPTLAANGKVYVFGDATTCLDARKGTVVWTGPQLSPRYPYSAGVLAGGALIGTTSNLALVGLDPEHGGQLWSVDRVGNYNVGALLAADETTAYMTGTIETNGVFTRFMLAIDLKTKALRWSQPRNSAADDNLAGLVSGKYLIYTNDKNNVVVRSTADGSQTWSKDFGYTGYQSPVRPLVLGSTLYLDGPTLLGYDLATGKQVYAAKAGKDHDYELPLAAGGNIVVQDLPGHQLVALDPHSGAVKWQSALELGLVPTSAVTIGTNFYVGTGLEPYGLYAVEQSGGHQLWNFQDGQTDKDWYLSTDGTLLFGVHGDKVYGLPPV
jgi:outer membrane protein assembly factor BamB